jgi:hypothetical protein
MDTDEARLRDKALALGRSAFDQWDAQRFRQVWRPAEQAGTILFKLIHTDPYDLGLCLAYAQLAGLRVALQLSPAIASTALGRTVATGTVASARSALWAVDRIDPSTGDPRRVLRVLQDATPITAFPRFDGEARDVSPIGRVIAAADARFQLAGLLAEFQPGPNRNATTHEQLDELVDSRRKSDGLLVNDFHTARCVHLGGPAEARILATEATEVYRVLAGARRLPHEQDLAWAEDQLRDVQRNLPLFHSTGE